MLFAIEQHLCEDVTNSVATGIGAMDEGFEAWGQERVRKDGCTGVGRIDVRDGSHAFLGPLEFSAFLRQSGTLTGENGAIKVHAVGR